MNTRAGPEKWSLSDLLALVALQPLMPRYVAWTAWSMRPAAIATVINEIQLKQRQVVVELGSGTSTVFLAQALVGTGGHLVSIEHDPEWAAYVSGLLERAGLGDVARVEVMALVPLDMPVGVTRWRHPATWYDVAHLRTVVPDNIDMLVVDGPPAGDEPDVLIRAPAVFALASRLASDYTIVLDDIDRAAERETVRRWEDDLRIEIDVIERLALAIGRSTAGLIPSL